MPGELVTAASILAGSGVSAWVADKLLGPSFDALGEQFRAYAGKRVTDILKRFQDKVEPEQLNRLPPGFAIQYFQRASFSEDDERLTEMWSNLLANAASNYNTRHAVFLDILSQIGPAEAQLLHKIPLDLQATVESQLMHSSAAFQNFGNNFSFDRDPNNQDMKTVRDAFAAEDFLVPGFITRLELNWRNSRMQAVSSPIMISKDEAFSLQVLQRQGLIEPKMLRHEHGPPTGPDVRADVLVLTVLGVEFLKSVEIKK